MLGPGGHEVVGEAGDVHSLLDLLDEYRPDVALVDLALPGIERPDELVGPLRDVMPGLKVIVVSDDTTDAVIAQTLISGADGFVVKEWVLEMLPTAVGSVVRGGTFIDPMAAEVLRAAVLEGPSDRYDASGWIPLRHHRSGPGLRSVRCARGTLR